MEINDVKISKSRMVLFLDGGKKFFVPLGNGFDRNNIKPFAYYREKYFDYNNSLATEECLNYLSYSSRTKKECLDYLAKKEYLSEVISAAISRIEELGYIDDGRFAAEYVKTKALFECWGPIKAKTTLAKKGVSQKNIAEALQFYTHEKTEEILDEVAQKLERKYSKLPRRTKETKISLFLRSRGFLSTDIKGALERARTELDEDEEESRQRDFFEGKIKNKALSLMRKNLEKQEILNRLLGTFLRQGASSELIRNVFYKAFEEREDNAD